MKQRFTTGLLLMLLLGLCACGSANNSGDITQSSTSDNTSISDDTSSSTWQERVGASDALVALLEEFNTAHQAVTAFTGDYEAYMERHEEPDFSVVRYQNKPTEAVSNDTVLTLEQLTEDMEILYRALRTSYGCYNYFGGDEAFRPAIDAVIADCAAMETITRGAVRESLSVHFAFVKDGHFYLGSNSANDFQVPFFYREIAYKKTDSGYQTQDGRTVMAVDGYDDLDELFKLSLTQEGELVYYPILLENAAYRAVMTGPVESSTVLTVQYSDGSSDLLTAETYLMDTNIDGLPNISVEEEQGIPVITANFFSWNTGANLFLNTAVENRTSDLLMVDLRKCRGGAGDIVSNWFQTYSGQTVSGHALMLNLSKSQGKEQIYPLVDNFIDMDNICIVLTSKSTASAGELFADISCNLENTLLIGENTMGCYRGSSGGIILPNSGLYMRFGTTLTMYPENDYFQEYRGFFPDIWCPQSEAKEAVLNFLSK